MKGAIHSILFTILVFTFLTTNAQKCPKQPSDKVAGSLVVNDNGKIYDADTLVKICLNTEVKISNTSPLTNIKYWFNYEGDSIPKQNGVSLITGKFKFLKEGTYTLIQQGESGSNKTYACKVIEVLGLTLPAVTATTCTAKSLTLEIPNVPDLKYDKYDIAWGDGQSSTVNKNDIIVSHNYPAVLNYTVVFTGKRDNMVCSSTNIFTIKPDGIPPYLPPSSIRKLTLDDKGMMVNLISNSTLNFPTNILQKEKGGVYQVLSQKVNSGTNQINTISGLDSTKQYCYKLQASDVCNNKVESNEVCTINLKVKPEDTKNLLTWIAYPNSISNYDILSNGGTIGLVFNNTTSSYSHQNTICGQEYCYQVVAKIGAIESVSQKRCVNGKSLKTLLPITEGLVSIDNNQINLSWKLPAGVTSNEINISKAEGITGVYNTVKKTNVSNYQETFDEKKDKDTRPCFKLNYVDNCNNISPNSEAFCPVILSSNGKDLNWTSYEKFNSQLSSIEVFDKQNTLIKTIQANGLFSLTPKPEDYTVQNLVFRLKTTSSDGRVSYSNTREINFSLKVLIPNIFTPNGDSINDSFKVYTVFQKTYQLQIFDRWGNIIFASTNPNEEWNGSIKNSPPVIGEYIYSVYVEGQDGTQIQKSGVINIIF
jgi:gliding motility-associated-like protein